MAKEKEYLQVCNLRAKEKRAKQLEARGGTSSREQTEGFICVTSSFFN